MPGYISEVRYEGGTTNDFIEIVVPTGTDTSAYSVAIYDKYGIYQSSVPLGALDAANATGDGYVIDPSDPGFIDVRHNYSVALVDDTGTVIQFLALTDPLVASGGPADGMTGTSSGVPKTLNTESIHTSDGGATYTLQTTPNPGTIPCFAPGTLIQTPDGPRAVETLGPGDRVLTLDAGPQEILWASRRDQPLDGTARDARPVLIRADAFAPGCPSADLIVSPQHRILVGGRGQLPAAFAAEFLVAAKALTDLPGIRPMMGRAGITWVHFALQRHHVVIANNCLSESLLLGPMVVNGLTAFQHRELHTIFGVRDDGPLNGPSARACLKPGQVRRLFARARQGRTAVSETAA